MLIAYNGCTDVECIVDAQMLLSIILDIDVVQPHENRLMLAWMTVCLIKAMMFLAMTGFSSVISF